MRTAARRAAGLPTDGWKMTVDDYVMSAKDLLGIMWATGFKAEYGAIPIDIFGEILGGAHRLACALALGIEEVPFDRKSQIAHAPPWGEQWFIDNGMQPADLDRLRQDWEALR